MYVMGVFYVNWSICSAACKQDCKWNNKGPNQNILVTCRK